LKSPINRYSIEVDEQVVRFSSSRPDEERVSLELLSAKEQYRTILLLQLYDFRPLLQLARSWHIETKENESSFSDETVPFVGGICDQLSELEQVAARFRMQLQRIMQQRPVDTAFFAERLRASSPYFAEKIETLLRTLQESAATTDSKANAMDYDEGITSVFTAAALKKELITATAGDFSVESYYAARALFRKPTFTITSYSRNTSGAQLKSIHPELLSELVRLRNQLSSEGNLPVYIVASIKTLVQMADYLPATEKELLRIDGIGKVKVERYGPQFLALIRNYSSAFGIASRMMDFKEQEKPKKRKKKK